MKTLAKLAMGAALAAGLAVTAAPAANAGVSVGVGIGVPAGHAYHSRHWCWRHPGACGHRGGVYVAGPRIGVFYHGRGWWDGHRYWGHRYWHGGHWRYR